MKPRKEKRARVYELYLVLGEFTHLSKHYHHGAGLYHIAARSLKEAYRYAEGMQWYTEASRVGILETTSGDNPWRHWGGTTQGQSYFHGKVVK